MIQQLIIGLVLVSASMALGSTQAVGIKGKLTCQGKPAGDVLIKLYDVDSIINTDDLMASGKTNSDGSFKMEGTADELTTIDPKMNIYHDCADGIKPCQRKLEVRIPDSYITHGSLPQKYFDFGVVELEGKFEGESRDCLHRL